MIIIFSELPPNTVCPLPALLPLKQSQPSLDSGKIQGIRPLPALLPVNQNRAMRQRAMSVDGRKTQQKPLPVRRFSGSYMAIPGLQTIDEE